MSTELSSRWSSNDRAEFSEIPRSGEGPPHIKATRRTRDMPSPMLLLLLFPGSTCQFTLWG
eukprot:4507548-Pyramimonas_sp.AAC.2